MLYKCTYESTPFWKVEFDTLWRRLEPGCIVLDMGEPLFARRPLEALLADAHNPGPKSRGIIDGRLYLKVFYGGRIGWVPHNSLVPLEEPAQAKNKKQKSAKGHVPLQ